MLARMHAARTHACPHARMRADARHHAQDYANKPEIQELLQKLTTDLVCDKPEDPLQYLELWVQKARAQQSAPHNQQH